jgi:hypothetical protein
MGRDLNALVGSALTLGGGALALGAALTWAMSVWSVIVTGGVILGLGALLRLFAKKEA